MLSQDLRRSFLSYFKNKAHTVVPSSPVIPHDDPTLLFINAGMNQFKDVFLGKSQREYTKAVTTQKCIRVGGKHNDLDNVGHTSRHLTFFEMLGNFSFGDYFKKEAIHYAWEVATAVFGFEPEKIWVSVYKEDDEAFALWEKHMPAKRIVRFGEKENFWAMGDVGPCGPCSELLYDRGEAFGKAKNPCEDTSGERYLEFWNLVFMQFSRDASGKIEPLPKQSIDTGSGLERVVSLKMGVDNVFQTDILRSLIAETENVSGKNYEMANAASFHVIADHIRSLAFAIADGVQPSNTARGYVLRKILRRAVRYGRMLGLQQPFLAKVYPRLVACMGDDFPELKSASSRIGEILTSEEEAFFRTLHRGGNLLTQVIEESRTSHKISGEDAFKLKDTYGFPLEEIQLIAKDEHLTIDLSRYEELEEEAKEKSRKAHKSAAQQFDAGLFAHVLKTSFEGYQTSTFPAKLLGIIVGGKFTDSIQEGEEGFLLLDKTPFYAEMGGQVGDTGQIAKEGNTFQVQDTLSPFPGVTAHFGIMTMGILRKEESVEASIDTERRRDIQNNHTATHLLHWALQQVFGSHIRQAGSLVEAKRFRFDFSHHKAVSAAELRQIEELVNEKIRSDEPVKTYELSYEEAQKQSEIKQFFGEKYGSKVRVVDIGFSKELCGGTHTSRVGTLGLFKIAKESSIAAGVRRIEALTARYAEHLVQSQEDLLHSLGAELKVPLSSVREKLLSLLEENKFLTQELKTLRKGALKQLVEKCLSHREQAGDIALIALEVSVSSEDLPSFAEELLHHLRSGVVALGTKTGERCQLLVAVSSDLTHIHAQSLIKEVAPLIQGGGGGKQSLAQAGGKDPTGLPKALDKIRSFLKNAK